MKQIWVEYNIDRMEAKNTSVRLLQWNIMKYNEGKLQNWRIPRL